MVSLLMLVWLLGANYFNLFVRRSEHFSRNEFRQIRPGMDVQDAISVLGKPILIRKSGGLVCKDCTAYYFLGDPPSWLPSFEEAWLLADNQGRIVQVVENAEP
jgi:hypothetical protein